MEQLLAWVKKLAVFMILCSYMEHLIPSHYKRYFHMCTGLILILMISTPLLRIVHGDMESEVICLLENLRTSSKGYQTDSTLEQEYRDYYMSQYKSAVTEQIEAQARSEGLCAEKITFSVDEDPESSSYGCLTDLALTVTKVNGRQAESSAVTRLKKNISRQMGIQESRIHLSDSQTLLVRQ